MLAEVLIWTVFIVGGAAPFAAMGWRMARQPAHRKAAARAAVAARPAPSLRLPDADETADAVRRFHRAVDRFLLSEGLKPDDWRGV